jgi:hypothetical protein
MTVALDGPVGFNDALEQDGHSDPEVIATRKLAFLTEQRAWLAHADRREH